MQSILITLTALSALAWNVQSQTTTMLSYSCRPDSGMKATDLPSCTAMNAAEAECSGADVAGRQKCFCNQQYFDWIFECENEMDRCYMVNYGQGDADIAASKWHTFCDTYVTAKPTTPFVSSLTTTIPAFCNNQLYQVCYSASISLVACSSSFIQDDAKWTSCLCNPILISQDYSCLFIGNTSCLQTSAATTNLALYRTCSNFQQVVQSITDAGNTTVPLPVQTSPTPTPPPQSSTTGPRPTGSTTTSGSNLAAAVSYHALAIACGIAFGTSWGF